MSLAITHTCEHPIELVEVPQHESSPANCPDEYRERLVIDTVHDGNFIPESVMSSPKVAELEQRGGLWTSYVRSRDWGAGLVAKEVAEALGLTGYYRVNIARVLLDFNRFPGSTQPDAGPLETMALGHPFSELLTHEQKRSVLSEYYDTISAGMETAIAGKIVKLSIHTYDERNQSTTLRPELSILSRSHSYQLQSRLPFGYFDPLFPDVLVECCSARILRDRLALTLEKAGFAVEHNYPYCLPDGSLEVRSQAWFFFRYLRQRFLETHPETQQQRGFERVWEMLLNTNLRSASSEALSGFLHRFRRPPSGQEDQFREAQLAYVALRNFVEDRPELVTDYRNSPARTSALSIEVRKDLVFEFDGSEPVAPREKNARHIGQTIAEALASYLRNDRKEVGRGLKG